MRIAYICADPGVPVFGCKGCSIHVQELISAALRRGDEVDLFATSLGGNMPHAWHNVTVHSLPLPATRTVAEREQACLRWNDVLHDALHDTSARLAPFDMVYERYSLWNESGMAFAKAQQIPGVLEVNAPLIEEQLRHRQLIAAAAAQQIAEACFRDASTVVCVSAGVADYVRTAAPGPRAIHNVPNGVALDRFLPSNGCSADLSARPPGQFVVGFVGTLKPWHGVRQLVEAFSRFRQLAPQAGLWIVGDGPERSRLQHFAEELGAATAQAIRWIGAVSPTEVGNYVQNMDVAVAPYPPQDNFYFSPLKLFEYMAAGRAIISSRIGQIPDWIESGQEGLLVTPGDVAELSDALASLYDSPALRNRLGAAARARAAAEYGWDAVTERIFGLARTDWEAQRHESSIQLA